MAMFDDFGKLPQPVQAPKAPDRADKTLGDISTIIESQRLYNPQMPSVPKAKPAPAAQAEMGTAAKAGMAGSWGKNV